MVGIVVCEEVVDEVDGNVVVAGVGAGCCDGAVNVDVEVVVVDGVGGGI